MHTFEPTLSNCYLSLCLFLPNYIIEDVSGDWFYDRPPCEGLVKSKGAPVAQLVRPCVLAAAAQGLHLTCGHLKHFIPHVSLHKNNNGSCKLKC